MKEEPKKLTPSERVRAFLHRYTDAKGRPPKFVPTVYQPPPDIELPSPAGMDVPEEDIDHGVADKGPALLHATPPQAPSRRPVRMIGGKVVNKDGTVHGGAFEEGDEPLPGPVSPRTGKPTLITPEGDPLEDVPKTGPSKPAWGPAPGDRVTY